MLSTRWRRHFDALLEGLDDLGYNSTWSVIDAADYGVPQRRKRILDRYGLKLMVEHYERVYGAIAEGPTARARRIMKA